ncbi:hypothetical protein RJT34_08072 [Clitoria ternatea]|uniref:Phenylalanyl-tRNA synthetase domain-containing protein n=1 Tax=Clitoria ternatea TaxID=43366 RepID=A0AAN9PVF0_CLITE
MFRPEILKPIGLPEDVQVIAWGLSLERPTMILYGIDNMRDLFGHKLMDAHITDSDWETSNDNSSSEDQEDVGFRYGGQVRSILSSLEESIGRIDDFLSFEKAFVHGDVVCSLSDPFGQMGRVTSVDMSVDWKMF